MKRPTQIPLDPKPREPLDARMQHLLDIGVLRPQKWSPTHYQLALEAGEDPSDPQSILRLGPSDAQAGFDPRDVPHERRHDTPAHKAAPAPDLSTKLLRLASALENLRTIAMKLRTTTAHAGTPSVRVMRDPATGSVIVERR